MTHQMARQPVGGRCLRKAVERRPAASKLHTGSLRIPKMTGGISVISALELVVEPLIIGRVNIDKRGIASIENGSRM
jgi:hypothetical protein